MPGTDAKELKSLFKKADGGESSLDYAFGLADKPENCAFLVHRTKKAMALVTELKADGKFKKIGCGSLTVAGGEVVLSQTKPVTQIEKMLLKIFKTGGVRYKPRVQGVEADADVAAADAEAPDAADPEAAAREARKRDRLAEIASLKARIDDVMKRLDA